MAFEVDRSHLASKCCAVCGLPAHRYSTADPHHKYDAIACVNGLRAILDTTLQRVQELELVLRGMAAAMRIVDGEGK